VKSSGDKSPETGIGPDKPVRGDFQ
jgi:hypothetical protein